MLKRFLKKIDQRFSIYTLCKVICVLLILFLLIKTQVVWGSWYRMLRSILQPFIIGFVLAYVMHPLVEFLEKKGIPKNFSIIAIWVCVLVFLIVMLVMLMPVLYDKINEFMTSMIDGVVWISNKIKTLGNMKDFSLVNSITNNIVNILQSYDDWVPQLVSSLPGLMNTVLNVVTNVLFSIIIAIYMLFDFERIKRGLRKFVHLFFKNSDIYLHEIDQNVTVYLKSLIILMLIKFIEYSAFYFMIGHQDWLIIGLLTMVMSVCLGYLLGALSGYVGGLTDKLIMRVADLVMTIPGLPLLIVAGAMLSELDFSPDSRIYMVVVMLSLLEWPRLARLVRGQCLSLRERDFMLATQVLGLSARRRLFGHLLPNTIPILVVMATMAVANAILSESALSYLGLGVVPPTPSWGNMMDAANSLIDFQRRPWLWMPPGIAIFITVIAINVLGDGLRDAMDPNMKPRLK